MKLGDFVGHFINPKNKQEKFEIKKLKLKENNISVDDLLNLKVKITKIKKFDEI